MDAAELTATTDADIPGLSLFMTMRANNASRLIEFLTEALGFVETGRFMDGDRVAHAELRCPNGKGGLMLADFREGEDYAPPPGNSSACIVTAEPDALYERAVAKGAEVIMPIDDMPYDSREFTICDPEGNLWSVGTYPGRPMPQ